MSKNFLPRALHCDGFYSLGVAAVARESYRFYKGVKL